MVHPRWPILPLLLASCIVPWQLEAQEQWFPIGPAPIQNAQTYGFNGTNPGSRVNASGRATVIAVNPDNPSDVWLGTATGGVWHSTDAGTTGMGWKPQTDFADSLAIGAIALDDCTTVRCNTIWVGTGENNIRRHTYYGAGLLRGTWIGGEFPGYSFAPVGDTPTRFARGNVIDIVVDGSDLYIAVSSGVTSSASQSTVSAPPPPDGYGIHHSPDGGATWSLLAPSPDGARPSDLERTPGGDLLAGFMGRGIFRRVGSAWCPLHPGLTVPAGCPPPATGLPDPGPASGPAFDHVEIAIAPSDPMTLYVVLGRCPSVTRDACVPELYRSSDGGASWEQATAGSTTGAIETYSRYTHALTVHPAEAGTLIYGGLKLWRSSDAGESFGQLGSPTIHPDHQDIVYPDPADPSLLYSANDGGFYYSTNGGTTWLSGNYDLQIAQFYSVGVDEVVDAGPGTTAVLGGTQDNGTNLFNGSRIWQHVLDADGGDSAIQDAWRMYATQQLIAPYASSGGGGLGSWSSIASGLFGTSAFYPPLVQHPVTKDVYFATDQLFRRPASGGAPFAPESPDFDTSGTVYPDIETTNTISAVAVAPSDAARIYVGHYDGAIWRTRAGGPCPGLEPDGVTPTCWEEVGGPNVSGDGLPDTVVSSLAVDPTDPDRVYATFSGFGSGPRVFTNGSAGSGAWSAMATGLPEIPANVVRVDPDDPSTLWLGTDRGIFRWTDPGTGWEGFGPARGMPNVPVDDIGIDNFRGRVYAATFGRGMFLLTTEPVLYTYEGWMDDEIWDILIYGEGFKASGGITSCTVEVIQEDGTICASGTEDAYGDTTVRIDPDSGTLVTDRQFYWEGKPVIAACLSGNCVGGADIDDCISPTNRIASVRVICGGQVGFASASPQCPQQANPPSSVLSAGSSPLDAETDGRFDVLVAIASTSVANGGDRVLCGTRVAYEAEDTAMAVARRVRDAVNAASSCVEAGVTASVPEVPERDRAGGEDFPQALPLVRVRAPGITGGQLVVSLRTAPGEATGVCFNLDSLGVLALNQLAIMRTAFDTPLGGAEGGTVTLLEQSPIGSCEITVPTTPGQSAEQIAAAVRHAFMTTGTPGLPTCEARQNPHDLMLDGPGLVSVFPTRLTVCSTDPGVGFTVGPDGVDLAGFPVDGAEEAAARRRGFGLLMGSSIPVDEADPVLDSGFGMRIDYRLPLAPRWTLVPALGYSGFNGEAGVPDRDLWDLTVAGRYQPLGGAGIRFFAEIGPGLYLPATGSTDLGLRLATGVNVPVAPAPDPVLELELGLEGHLVFGDDQPDFLRPYLGLVVRH